MDHCLPLTTLDPERLKKRRPERRILSKVQKHIQQPMRDREIGRYGRLIGRHATVIWTERIERKRRNEGCVGYREKGDG